jgi:hypothetical protein
LRANPTKSSLFCAGLPAGDKSVLLDTLQVKEGSLPVRYLGVPLITKKLSSVDCQALVDKISSRVDSWLVKHLSFAGRLQLISSVLFSLQVFWARVFILPKKIIRLLEQKMNRFLWGNQDSRARARVSWENVYVPRKEGGLGLKRLETWNKAAMLNHIWNLFVQAGSLWVAWVEVNWLKGRSFWQVAIPNPCPWSWRKLLNLRDLAKQFIRFRIGDGNKAFLWYDHWHPDGCLIDKYGPRVMFDAASQKEAKVSSIMKHGDWFWAGARSESVAAIQMKLFEVSIEGGPDVPFWNSKRGSYNCADVWDSLRIKQPMVSWWKVVWFNLAIPRLAFCLWLTFRDALLTRDELVSWGFAGSMECLFCHASLESRDHLFFECSFSRRVWRAVMEACLISDPKLIWDDVSAWSSSAWKGKSFAATVCKLSLAATVYHLWRRRNDLLHGNPPRSEEALASQVKREVRIKLLSREFGSGSS